MTIDAAVEMLPPSLLVEAIYGASKVIVGQPYDSVGGGDLSQEDSAAVAAAIARIVDMVESEAATSVDDLPKPARNRALIELYSYLQHRIAPPSANESVGKQLLAELYAAA